MPDPDAVPGLHLSAGPRVGESDELAWIHLGTDIGRTITSAIPPTFAAYATVVIPDGDAEKARADAALVDVLRAHTTDQPWWLGYLDTGVADVVEPDAPLEARAVSVGQEVTPPGHQLR